MAWRLVCGVLVLTCGLAGSGCAGDTGSAPLPSPQTNPLEVARPTGPPSTVSRMQRDELDGPPVGKSLQLVQATTAVPPPPAADSGRARGLCASSVRAWVNDKPIFESEVERIVYGKHMSTLLSLKNQEAQLTKVFRQLFDEELKLLIESELVYQDAMKKLEPNQRMLDKLKAAAAKDFEKQLRIEDEVRQERQLGRIQTRGWLNKALPWKPSANSEREFIGRQYMQSLISSPMQKIGQLEVRDWYDQHANEFLTVDSVKWQDIFILGDNHPGPGGARRFAEESLARLSAAKTSRSSYHSMKATVGVIARGMVSAVSRAKSVRGKWKRTSSG